MPNGVFNWAGKTAGGALSTIGKVPGAIDRAMFPWWYESQKAAQKAGKEQRAFAQTKEDRLWEELMLRMDAEERMQEQFQSAEKQQRWKQFTDSVVYMSPEQAKKAMMEYYKKYPNDVMSQAGQFFQPSAAPTVPKGFVPTKKTIESPTGTTTYEREPEEAKISPALKAALGKGGQEVVSFRLDDKGGWSLTTKPKEVVKPTEELRTPEYLQSLKNAVAAINTNPNAAHKIYAKISASFPQHSAELRRILLSEKRDELLQAFITKMAGD